jgi:hypothetical protein
MLASASNRHQLNASDNDTAQFCAALPLQVQHNLCVCVSDVVVVVVTVLLFLPWCSAPSLLLLLLLSLTSCCSGASPVLVQAVLVSGCMLLLLAVLSLFVVVGVVVGSFAVLLLLLPEVICYLSFTISCRCCWRCVAASSTEQWVRLRQLSSSSPLCLLLSWYPSSLLLLLLLLSLTSCCSGASPVLEQIVLMSGCMLFCVGCTVALRCGRYCRWFLRGVVAAPV